MLSVILLSDILPSVVMLCVIMLSVLRVVLMSFILPSLTMLFVITLSVTILNVMVYSKNGLAYCRTFAARLKAESTMKLDGWAKIWNSLKLSSVRNCDVTKFWRKRHKTFFSSSLTNRPNRLVCLFLADIISMACEKKQIID